MNLPHSHEFRAVGFFEIETPVNPVVVPTPSEPLPSPHPPKPSPPPPPKGGGHGTFTEIYVGPWLPTFAEAEKDWENYIRTYSGARIRIEVRKIGKPGH